MSRGCKTCFNKGEEFRPLKDDRDMLIGKMMTSDEAVFASPNYSYRVAAVMKIFLDGLGFVFHRPRFFGRTFTSIVVQGIYDGSKIVEHLDFVGRGLVSMWSREVVSPPSNRFVVVSSFGSN
jgi:multimeric flavodoxin WrbA